MKFNYSAVLEAEIDDSEVIEAIVEKYAPDEVYPERELTQWAEENGYVKQEAGDE